MVAPPSYEHAHAAMVTLDEQSALSPASLSKQTVSMLDASPNLGVVPRSHPVRCVPQRPQPGGVVGIRSPAAPPKRYQLARGREGLWPIGMLYERSHRVVR